MDIPADPRDAPPPPPPDVLDLSEKRRDALSASLRQRIEQHRSDPNCASCHSRMDPLGFGFENDDAIGAWRELDGKFPIDPSGKLPAGATFRGSNELKAILKEGDGDRHNHDDLPILLAGRGGGSIQTGRHLKFGMQTPLNNLHLSMLERMDVPVDTLGDSTGKLTGLSA